ncbi:MAG: hypothetical protein MJ053_04180, partial [Elusimicrobiaceae bacterium]|nr:hypothetical protein [Elusimicrobiaceae bacterium]
MLIKKCRPVVNTPLFNDCKMPPQRLFSYWPLKRNITKRVRLQVSESWSIMGGPQGREKKIKLDFVFF